MTPAGRVPVDIRKTITTCQHVLSRSLERKADAAREALAPLPINVSDIELDPRESDIDISCRV